MDESIESGYSIQPLDAGSILDHAIYLYRDQFKLIAMITGLLFFPVLITLDWVMLVYQERYEEALAMGGLPPVEFFVVLFLYMVIYQFLAIPLLTGALMYGLAMRYLGRPATFGHCMRHMARRSGRLIAAGVLYQMIVLAGTCLCIVPGIYASVIFIPLFAVITLEDTPVLAAFSRCNYLMQGERMKGLLVLFAILVITVASGVLDAFAGLPYFSFVYADIVQALAIGLPVAIWMVFYFSARCRAENLDLDLAVQAVEQETLAEAPAL